MYKTLSYEAAVSKRRRLKIIRQEIWTAITGPHMRQKACISREYETGNERDWIKARRIYDDDEAA